MNLGNIFKRDSQSVRVNDNVKTAESMSKGERTYRVQSEIRNLAPGQTIQGTVVSRDGTSAQIALRQDMMISARIDQSINLVLGQNMSFEVKANSGSVLSLSPLYANMANEATIMRALNAAGLPETANNIEMVAVMMEEGMPIDKESLGNISRLLMEFPTQNPASLIQLTRRGIAVTESNFEQFEIYQNANHQLLGSAETIMSELPNIFHELLGEGKVSQAYAFYENVLDIFTGGGAEGELLQKGDGNAALSGGIIETADGSVGVKDAQAAAAEIKNASGEAVLDMVGASKNEGVAGANSEQTPVLTDKQWNALGNMLKELGIDENTAEQIKNGEMTSKEALALIRGLIPKAGASEQHARMMERILDGKEFESLLKSEIGKQWLIEPKNVADPHKVEQLYERIREQSARLQEALQTSGKGDDP